MWTLMDVLVRLVMVALWIGGGAFVLACAVDSARERQYRGRFARDRARRERSVAR